MIEKLINMIKEYNPSFDQEKVVKAFNLAAKAHDGQFRKSGEKYIIHPVCVSEILAELQMDTATICAGLLHDVIEDTDVTKDDLIEEFDEDVANIVDGVTKIKNLKYQSGELNQAENIRKMVLAMSKDLRVVIVKLADRLHNLRTLEYMADEKRVRISKETLDIYAPLAHRLGISKIKWELEDLCLRHLEPDAYYDLVEKVNKKRIERESQVQFIKDKLSEKLKENNIKFHIEGRPKNFYSIYKKMKDQNKSFDSIYDLIAVRIIVDTISDCYGALGVVHSLWKPIPGRVKDYIAMPKPNMYQSLHTTVISKETEIFEIQIRTWDMHKTAEYGIAAHWIYKEKLKNTDNFDKNLKWLSQLIEWQNELSDPKDFIETLKVDFFNDEIFVLTPNGDVIDLPRDATPVDFAYRVHTDVGNSCIGAKVDGKIVPLNHKLSTGSVVEIVRSKNECGPSRDWLKFVKSTRAKSKIKSWFRNIDKDDNIQIGKDLLLSELKRLNLKVESVLNKSNVDILCDYFSATDLDDIYQFIGYGNLKLNTVVNKIKTLVDSDEVKDNKILLNKTTKKNNYQESVVVDDMPDLKVKFSKCCNPLPGDEIVGFITKGRGISVHRCDCPNVSMLKDKMQTIKVKWRNDYTGTFNSDIEIRAVDRVGLLSEITGYIREQSCKLIGLNAKVDETMVIITMSLEVDNLVDLEKIIKEIKSIPSVLNVYRRIN